MIDNSTNKLDETIKNKLSHYEAAYDATDWARMERMLDAAPKAKTINWKYAAGIAAIIAVMGGGYLTFKMINTPDTNNVPVQSVEDSSAKAPSLPEKNIVPVTVPAASVKEDNKEPEKKEDEPVIVKETEAISKDESRVKEKESKKEITRKKDSERKKKKSEDSATTLEEEDFDFSKTPIIDMGNEPIFPDMLDSSKGIKGSTKEKESTRKAAKAKKEQRLDFNKIINLNADSLKKFRDQMKKDSL